MVDCWDCTTDAPTSTTVARAATAPRAAFLRQERHRRDPTDARLVQSTAITQRPAHLIQPLGPQDGDPRGCSRREG